MASIDAQRDDIQGNILRAYGFPCARYEILRIVDAEGARALLRNVLARDLITTATDWDEQSKPDSALNVFLSWKGLASLGLPAASLDSFPDEFKAGMASRARELGDIGPNAPDQWEFGADRDATHVFFALYGRTADARARTLDALRAELAAVGPAVTVTHSLDAAHLPTRREHFGYADGIGQPSIEGGGVEEFPGDGTPLAGPQWAPLKAGEFVLGWPGETGAIVPMPAPDVLGRNGSFLVYRKLKQDVLAFRAFLRAQARRLFGSDKDDHIERIAAKLVGRWRSGCPVLRSPDADDPVLARDWSRNNDFRYVDDPSGLVCPIGSHIRRMNPRDALDHTDTVVRLHRIIRRGLPYGALLDGDADDGVERGVAFMAINASIKYQFEFLQSEWVNNGEFAGLSRDDVDPFSGEPRERSRFRVPMPDAAPKNVFDLPRFVTMRGGEYFFVPSLTALRLIAGGTP